MGGRLTSSSSYGGWRMEDGDWRQTEGLQGREGNQPQAETTTFIKGKTETLRMGLLSSQLTPCDLPFPLFYHFPLFFQLQNWLTN